MNFLSQLGVLPKFFFNLIFYCLFDTLLFLIRKIPIHLSISSQLEIIL